MGVVGVIMQLAGMITQVAGQTCCNLSVSGVLEFGLRLDSLYTCIGLHFTICILSIDLHQTFHIITAV